MSDQVFILGAGRAGRGLARALAASGVPITGLHGRRSETGAQPVSAGALPQSALTAASIVIVTVRDQQLEAALSGLEAAPLSRGAVVLHASGSRSPAAAAALIARGHPVGTFHPLVPLSDPARTPETLRGAWIGVDGDPAAVAAARRLAELLGASVLEIPSGEKARYHAAAVFASNFPVVLIALARRLLHEAGIPDPAASRALVSLLGSAAANLRAEEPGAALTGPIARGDTDAVRRHLAALATDDEARRCYVALSRAAVSLARAGGANAGALAEIEALLE